MKTVLNRITNVFRHRGQRRIERRLQALNANARNDLGSSATQRKASVIGDDRWDVVLNACGATSAAAR